MLAFYLFCIIYVHNNINPTSCIHDYYYFHNYHNIPNSDFSRDKINGFLSLSTMHTEQKQVVQVVKMFSAGIRFFPWQMSWAEDTRKHRMCDGLDSHARSQTNVHCIIVSVVTVENKNKNKEMPLNLAAYRAFYETQGKYQDSCPSEMQFC